MQRESGENESKKHSTLATPTTHEVALGSVLVKMFSTIFLFDIPFSVAFSFSTIEHLKKPSREQNSEKAAWIFLLLNSVSLTLVGVRVPIECVRRRKNFSTEFFLHRNCRTESFSRIFFSLFRFGLLGWVYVCAMKSNLQHVVWKSSGNYWLVGGTEDTSEVSSALPQHFSSSPPVRVSRTDWGGGRSRTTTGREALHENKTKKIFLDSVRLVLLPRFSRRYFGSLPRSRNWFTKKTVWFSWRSASTDLEFRDLRGAGGERSK